MKSNIFYDQDKIPKGYILLASIDESEPYEVDVSEIYYNTEKNNFVLMTASGCSCWSGEYEEEFYKKLEDIEKYLFARDDKGYVYHPSVKGAQELVAEAIKNWKIYDQRR